MEKWERDLVVELNGVFCQCGKCKKVYQSFCRDCYYKLPREIQRALYRDVWAGYFEARVAAGRYLGEARFKEAEIHEEFHEVLGL